MSTRTHTLFPYAPPVLSFGDRTGAQGHAVQAVRARTGTQRRRAVRQRKRALAQRRAALAARPRVPADRRRVLARRPRAVAERRRTGAAGFGRDQPEERAATHRSRLLARRQPVRSEEHTSELQSLMRISYAVFLLKKKNTHN